MSADDYTSIPSAGKLKLKGVKDSKVSKKKKLRTRDENPKNDLEDNFVMLKTLEDEDREIRKEERGKQRESHKQGIEENSAEDFGVKVKTEAEKRYEEQRRKRVRINSACNFKAVSGKRVEGYLALARIWC